MNKNYILLVIVIFSLTNSFIYSTNGKEQFIDPKKYLETNNYNNNIKQDAEKTESSVNQKVQQDIIEYLSEQELRNEKKRKDNVKSQTNIQDSTNTSFEFPYQNYPFNSINAIVLDAGHGGKDSGGSSNSIEEKRLVLTLVKKIHALFKKHNKKIKVYVTRHNDTFIPLEERVSKTSRWSVKNNILFVSIHGNIAYNSGVAGFEIYTLSDRASDSDALATERIENAGFSIEDIEQTESIYSILADLIRDGTRIQSEWLAKYVYDHTLKTTQAYGRGLKRANFFVLKYNTVPSILIEVGYMSNKIEAEKLKNEKYQNQLAIGIFQGISYYIKEYNQTKGFTQ